MKRIIGTLSLILCINLVGTSQGLHLGLKAGTDLHKISGASFKDQFNFGYHLGGILEIKLNDKWGVQAEGYYSETSLRAGDSLNDLVRQADPLKIRFAYINVPILLNWKIFDQLSIQVGPKYGIALDQQKSIANNITLATKSGDFSAVAGLQVHLPKIRIYARYQIGLNNISDLQDQGTWKNQVIHAGVGLMIF
jgi:hypothetical protein